ncbi:MAG: hypothetical protein OEW32_05440 [Nitrospira sp.]|nr:hypothetical protein [Nitrospira sp.]
MPSAYLIDLDEVPARMGGRRKQPHGGFYNHEEFWDSAAVQLR